MNPPAESRLAGPSVSPVRWASLLRGGDPEVARWYACAPSEVAEHAREMKRVWEPLRPEEIAEWRGWLAPHEPSEAVTRNLGRLADPRALAVITGQQAGLLGGPLFTLYKAAGAVHLARRLEKKLKRPVVPVFWVASDDHDFAEVASATWLADSGGLETLAAGEPGLPGSPVYDQQKASAAIADEVRASAERSLSGAKHFEELQQFLSEWSDAAAAGWEEQFVRCLVRWLGESGIVPVAPRLSFVRRRGAAVMRQEIRAGTETSRLLQDAAAQLAEAGVGDATLHRHGHEANFFLHLQAGRCRVVRDGERFVAEHPISGERIAEYTEAEMLSLLSEQPELFSPNAALRPLVQDAAFPTAAYVAGPSETVYHAQIGPLYERFGIARPAVAPRPGAVLVEPRVRRVLEAWGWQPGEPLPDAEGARALALAHSDTSAAQKDAAERLARLEADAAALKKLGESELKSTGVERAAARLVRSIGKAKPRLAERIEAAALERDEVAHRRLELVQNSFWPNGVPQERGLCALAPLFAHCGQRGMTALVESLDPEADGLQVILTQDLPDGR